MSQIESPCVLVCAIDPKTGYCFGCGRTAGEIANWLNYSAQERRQIMDGLGERLEKVERKPRRVTRRRQIAGARGETVSRAASFGGEEEQG